MPGWNSTRPAAIGVSPAMATSAATRRGRRVSARSRTAAQAGVVLAEDLVVHGDERVDTPLIDDRPQLHARGRRDVQREVGDLGDEQRLGRLGREPAATSRSGRSGGRS